MRENTGGSGTAALENVQQIDLIGLDKQSGNVIISIIDDITWQDEYTNLSLLQDKINNYLRFVENGKLLTAYPDAVGRKIVLKVFSSSKLSETETAFFSEAAKIIVKAGYQLVYKVVEFS